MYSHTSLFLTRSACSRIPDTSKSPTRIGRRATGCYHLDGYVKAFDLVAAKARFIRVVTDGRHEKHQNTDAGIAIEWTNVGADGGGLSACDQMRRLARVLGKIAARRDLARLGQGNMGACPLSDSKISKS